MNTKKLYTAPSIEQIVLDNEISLQLSSSPNPLGEPDWMSYSGMKNDPLVIDSV